MLCRIKRLYREKRLKGKTKEYIQMFLVWAPLLITLLYIKNPIATGILAFIPTMVLFLLEKEAEKEDREIDKKEKMIISFQDFYNACYGKSYVLRGICDFVLDFPGFLDSDFDEESLLLRIKEKFSTKEIGDLNTRFFILAFRQYLYGSGYVTVGMCSRLANEAKIHVKYESYGKILSIAQQQIQAQIKWIIGPDPPADTITKRKEYLKHLFGLIEVFQKLMKADQEGQLDEYLKELSSQGMIDHLEYVQSIYDPKIEENSQTIEGETK